MSRSRALRSAAVALDDRARSVVVRPQEKLPGTRSRTRLSSGPCATDVDPDGGSLLLVLSCAVNMNGWFAPHELVGASLASTPSAAAPMLAHTCDLVPLSPWSLGVSTVVCFGQVSKSLEQG